MITFRLPEMDKKYNDWKEAGGHKENDGCLFCSMKRATKEYKYWINLEDQEKYIFIATHRWPFLGLMRYYTYPNIPVDPLQAEETDTWIVYRRPDFTIDARGRLTSDGIAFSSPGKVLHEFEKGTFVFRVQ